MIRSSREWEHKGGILVSPDTPGKFGGQPERKKGKRKYIRVQERGKRESELKSWHPASRVYFST